LRQRVVAGDLDALAEVYQRHYLRLRRIVELLLDKRLRGRVDAEDVLQEGYIKASQRINKFIDSHENSLLLWLKLNVKQTLYDVHRRHLAAEIRSARRDVPLTIQTGSGVRLQPIEGHEPTPSTIVTRRETAAQLAWAMKLLKPFDRRILQLRHIDQMPNQEVATQLGISEKAASMRYTRALHRLGRILSKHGGGNPAI